MEGLYFGVTHRDLRNEAQNQKEEVGRLGGPVNPNWNQNDRKVDAQSALNREIAGGVLKNQRTHSAHCTPRI
jgi:hypothetical protein